MGLAREREGKKVNRQKKMTANPARLRWLIRLDDEEGGGSDRNDSRTATDEDLLAALRSLPPPAGEGEEGGGTVNTAAGGGGGGGGRCSCAPLQRLLQRNSHARPIDRRRALASCLAQHAAVCAGLGLEWERSPGISRTAKGGKPFVSRKREERGEGAGRGEEGAGATAGATAPNFNFNVSHDGPWLALAAEPLLLVGVDVASPRVIGGRGGAGNDEGGSSSSSSSSSPEKAAPPAAAAAAAAAAPPLGAARLRRSLGSALADSEWRRVSSEPDAASQDILFRRFWALRESWSKARGDGLGSRDLSRAEFSIGGGGGDGGEEEGEAEPGLPFPPPSSPSSPPPPPPLPPPRIALRLDGIAQEQWAFELHDLPDGSALAVALGPPSAVVDAGGTFLETLGRTAMTGAEVEEEQRELRVSRREAAGAAAAAVKNDSPPSWRRMSVRALIEMAEMTRRGRRVPGEEETG